MGVYVQTKLMAMPWEWFGLVITLVQNVAPLYL